MIERSTGAGYLAGSCFFSKDVSIRFNYDRLRGMAFIKDGK